MTTTRSVAPDGQDRLDLEEIVLSSGLPSRNSATRDSLLQIVTVEGRVFKVRKYMNDRVAEHKAGLVRDAWRFFPNFRGCFGRYLVFEYLKGTQPERSPTLMAQVGSLLAGLGGCGGPASLGQQFESWCDELKALGVFRSATIAVIHDCYDQWKPLSFRWTLAHLGLSPNNLILTKEGALLPIDEKSLHYGPLHLGLVKARSDYPGSPFEMIAGSYYEGMGHAPVEGPNLDDPTYDRFLCLYAEIALLVTNVTSAPRMIWQQRPILHERRRRVLRLIGASRWARLKEEIPATLEYGGRSAVRRVLRAKRKLFRG